MNERQKTNQLRALTAHYPIPPAALRSQVLSAWAQAQGAHERSVFEKFWIKLQWYWVPALSLATLIGGYFAVTELTGWKPFSTTTETAEETQSEESATAGAGKKSKSTETEDAETNPGTQTPKENETPTASAQGTSASLQNGGVFGVGGLKKDEKGSTSDTEEETCEGENCEGKTTRTKSEEESVATSLFIPTGLKFNEKTRRLTWTIDPQARHNGLRGFEVYTGKDAYFTVGSKAASISSTEFSAPIETNETQFFVKVSALYAGQTVRDSDPLLATVKPKVPTLTAFYIYYFRRGYGRWVWPDPEKVAIPTAEKYAEIQVKYAGDALYTALYRIFDNREFVILNYDPSKAARLRIAYKSPTGTWLYGPEFRFCPGDINKDHLVNQEDIRILSSIPEGTRTPETKPELYMSADLNGDSVITSADRSIIDIVLGGRTQYVCP